MNQPLDGRTMGLLRRLDPAPNATGWAESPQGLAILERIAQAAAAPPRPARVRPRGRLVLVAALVLGLVVVAATANAEVRGRLGGAISRYLHVDYSRAAAGRRRHPCRS